MFDSDLCRGVHATSTSEGGNPLIGIQRGFLRNSLKLSVRKNKEGNDKRLLVALLDACAPSCIVVTQRKHGKSRRRLSDALFSSESHNNSHGSAQQTLRETDRCSRCPEGTSVSDRLADLFQEFSFSSCGYRRLFIVNDERSVLIDSLS